MNTTARKAAMTDWHAVPEPGARGIITHWTLRTETGRIIQYVEQQPPLIIRNEVIRIRTLASVASVFAEVKPEQGSSAGLRFYRDSEAVRP